MEFNVKNESFRKHIFDTVVTTIGGHLATVKKQIPITTNSEFDWDLDMSYTGICFLLDDLERKTLLNLDVQLDSIITVGDVCTLIEQRLQKANKQELLAKINSIPLTTKFFKSLAIKTK